MGFGISAWSLRNVLDHHLKFVNAGLKVYLRKQNVVDSNEQYAKMGFLRTGQSPSTSGFTDTEIDPQPDAQAMSFHDIGVNGGRLNFGAHKFLISHTFVLAQMALISTSDPYQVFRADNVMGIYYNNRLFSIDSITPVVAGGEIISWDLVGNAVETESPAT